MATGLEWTERAKASEAQAAASPAICKVFPAAIDRRPKTLRRGGGVETFMFANTCRWEQMQGLGSHIVAGECRLIVCIDDERVARRHRMTWMRTPRLRFFHDLSVV